MRTWLLCLTATTLAASISACKNDTREWRATDHDQPQQAEAPAQPRSATSAVAATDPWVSSCVPCHGADGRGDTPMGRAMRVPDLTSADRQAQYTDEQMAEVITNGRGRMPGFRLEPAAVQSLVSKVRALKK